MSLTVLALLPLSADTAFDAVGGSTGFAGACAFRSACPYGIFSSAPRVGSDRERMPDTLLVECVCVMTCGHVRTSIHQSCILRTSRHTEYIFTSRAFGIGSVQAVTPTSLLEGSIGDMLLAALLHVIVVARRYQVRRIPNCQNGFSG